MPDSLFGSFGLFGFSSVSNKTNKTGQTNEINQPNTFLAIPASRARLAHEIDQIDLPCSALLLHLSTGPDNSKPRTHNSELPQAGGVLSRGETGILRRQRTVLKVNNA